MKKRHSNEELSAVFRVKRRSVSARCDRCEKWMYFSWWVPGAKMDVCRECAGRALVKTQQLEKEKS